MKEFRTKIGEKELIIKLNDLAEQANGSALVQYGDTVVLGTATMSSKDRSDLEFFPLSVDYEERFYAAGKIRGSRFTKREARPSDSAIITSRLIDRAIRPRFPENLKRDVQAVATCLSWDAENDPDVVGFLAVSLSLAVSDIPWNGPLAIVKVGQVNNQFIINPTYQEQNESSLNLIFTGFKNDKKETIINMIESGLKEVNEETVLEAFRFAEKEIQNICSFMESVVQEIGKPKIEIPLNEIDQEFNELIKNEIEKDLKQALREQEKTERNKKIEKTKEKVSLFINEKYPQEPEKEKQGLAFLENEISRIIKENILLDDYRPDGRKPDELRKLDARVSVLPRTHGSGLFARGETKSLSILTLGAPGDHQLLEGMEDTKEKRFLHHYNFPPYSVGEVKQMRGPGRRDIGHGILAEKALFPVIPLFEDFPYTIRIVSEIVSSNGSTSMASVSGSTLALMDAGVPIKSPVAGISIGIISESDEKYKLLVDIQGKEDHCGGMDLKIAGTRKGLTALQMDVKIEGITIKILEEALEKGKQARYQILDKIESVIPEPRKNLSPFAPRVMTFQINPDKIREVIGSGGKVINEIISKTKATIDIDDSGTIFITAEKESNALEAVEWIKNIVREVQVGEIFQGKVKRIMEFGCFVEILPGQEGLVHISKLSDKRVTKVEDIVKMGDVIPVKVIEIDSQGRINLSLKDAK
jgi:polyribonucleotide nucleotidyltransferase